MEASPKETVVPIAAERKKRREKRRIIAGSSRMMSGTGEEGFLPVELLGETQSLEKVVTIGDGEDLVDAPTARFFEAVGDEGAGNAPPPPVGPDRQGPNLRQLPVVNFQRAAGDNPSILFRRPEVPDVPSDVGGTAFEDLSAFRAQIDQLQDRRDVDDAGFSDRGVFHEIYRLGRGRRMVWVWRRDQDDSQGVRETEGVSLGGTR